STRLVATTSGVRKGARCHSVLLPTSSSTVRQPARLPASTSSRMSPMSQERSRSISRSRAAACINPGMGLMQAAARERDIDLERSWLIGDILDDVEAGKRAGCRTVLLDVGNKTEWQRAPLRTPDVVATSLV